MSVSQTRHSTVLVLLLGCVRGVVLDLQFLGNFLHRIALISLNKNRLTSFRRNLFISSHFEPVIEPTNAQAQDI